MLIDMVKPYPLWSYHEINRSKLPNTQELSVTPNLPFLSLEQTKEGQKIYIYFFFFLLGTAVNQ